MNRSKEMKIHKTDVDKLLLKTTEKWTTYAPIKKMAGEVYLEQITGNSKTGNISKISFDYTNMIFSHKDIFFPQSEKLFSYDNNKIIVDIPKPNILIFGIRSCDVTAMLFTDGFFKRNTEDVYYSSKTDNRFIISVGCIVPPRPEACFCTSTKTGPFLENGFDLQFIDNGDHFLVETGSEKGADFLLEYGEFFEFAQQEEIELIPEIKSNAEKAVTLKVDFDKALKLMSDENFIPKDLYQEIADKCIYCGGCVYVCPTCTCFNVYDNGDLIEGDRNRNWDACLFSGYTREASGHNPREEKWIRTARRYEHKLKYDPMVSTISGCVGCGRCLSNCPVNLGMSEFIEKITTENNR